MSSPRAVDRLLQPLHAGVVCRTQTWCREHLSSFIADGNVATFEPYAEPSGLFHLNSRCQVRLIAGASEARGKGGAVIRRLKHVVILERYSQTLFVKGIFNYLIVL